MRKNKTPLIFIILKFFWKILLIVLSPIVLLVFLLYGITLFLIDFSAKLKEYGLYDEQTIKRRSVERQRQRRKSFADFFMSYVLEIFR